VLDPLRFSTRDLAPEEQFSAWQAYTALLADLKLPQLARPSDGFPADHAAWNLDGMLVIQQQVPAHSYARTAEKLRASPLDHWCLTFTRSGQAWTEVNGRVAETGPGRIELRSLAHPFSGRITQSDSLVIYLPRELFRNSSALMDASNNEVLSDNLASVLVDYLKSVEMRLGSLTAEDLPRIVSTTRDIILACLSQIPARGQATDQQMNVALMERARQYIQRGLHSPDLTPDMLCRELGISRTRLYQLFEPNGGVLHYIQKRRLNTAHAVLSDQSNTQRIADIAESVGFMSLASFSRAFSNEFGYSPREARNVPSPLFAKRTVADTEASRSFNDWLRLLGS
jgi:AraC-like DNA-binding protein